MRGVCPFRRYADKGAAIAGLSRWLTGVGGLRDYLAERAVVHLTEARFTTASKRLSLLLLDDHE
jgi:hypothetical protein